ncbi:MAG TPA: hypothetical protein VL688_03305 [Verrucomicrobiae bacterium]|jgi:hypothetical protein|nr:hypothetical protein [Verrucomicrobiae bacterium]
MRNIQTRFPDAHQGGNSGTEKRQEWSNERAAFLRKHYPLRYLRFLNEILAIAETTCA